MDLTNLEQKSQEQKINYSFNQEGQTLLQTVPYKDLPIPSTDDSSINYNETIKELEKKIKSFESKIINISSVSNVTKENYIELSKQSFNNFSDSTSNIKNHLEEQKTKNDNLIDEYSSQTLNTFKENSSWFFFENYYWILLLLKFLFNIQSPITPTYYLEFIVGFSSYIFMFLKYMKIYKYLVITVYLLLFRSNIFQLYLSFLEGKTIAYPNLVSGYFFLICSLIFTAIFLFWYFRMKTKLMDLRKGFFLLKFILITSFIISLCFGIYLDAIIFHVYLCFCYLFAFEMFHNKERIESNNFSDFKTFLVFYFNYSFYVIIMMLRCIDNVTLSDILDNICRTSKNIIGFNR